MHIMHMHIVMHSTNCVVCWLVTASTLPATSAGCEPQCTTNTFCRRWQNLTMITHPTYQKCVGTFGIRSGISSLQHHTLADLTPAVQTLLKWWQNAFALCTIPSTAAPTPRCVPCSSDPSPPGAQFAVKPRRSTAYIPLEGEELAARREALRRRNRGCRQWAHEAGWVNRADSHPQEPPLPNDQIQLEDEDWGSAVVDISLLLPEDLEEMPGDPVEACMVVHRDRMLLSCDKQASAQQMQMSFLLIRLRRPQMCCDPILILLLR